MPLEGGRCAARPAASPDSRGSLSRRSSGSRSTSVRRSGAAQLGLLGEEVGGIGVVVAEELVAALTGERNLHVLGGELRDEVGRQGRGIGERLVECVREGWEQEGAVGTSTSSRCFVP